VNVTNRSSSGGLGISLTQYAWCECAWAAWPCQAPRRPSRPPINRNSGIDPVLARTSVRDLRRLFLTISLVTGLCPLGSPMLVCAADQERGRRHSLIHRPATGTMPQTTSKQGTITAGTDNQRPQILEPPSPSHAPSSSAPTTSSPHRKLTNRPEIATVTPVPSPPTTPSFATKPKTAGPATSRQTNTTAGTPVVSQGTTLKPSSSFQGLASTSVAPATVRPLSASLVSAPNSSTSSLSSTSSGTATPLVASGSRSAANLLQNPAIASLLQPPAPIVTYPPASQSPAPTLPPSTPPLSTSPPAPPAPTTGSAILTWSSNREPDLAG